MRSDGWALNKSATTPNAQTDKKQLNFIPPQKMEASLSVLLHRLPVFSAAVFVFCLMKCGANVWQKDQLKANWVKLNGKWDKFEGGEALWRCVIIIYLSLCTLSILKKATGASRLSRLLWTFVSWNINWFLEKHMPETTLLKLTFTGISCSCSTGLEFI